MCIFVVHVCVCNNNNDDDDDDGIVVGSLCIYTNKLCNDAVHDTQLARRFK